MSDEKESQVFLVQIANIMPLWPQVAPLLERALDSCKTHRLEDVRAAILSAQAQLWVQWNDKVEAAVVTQFTPYPVGLWLRIWLMGAVRGSKANWAKFEEIIRAWGKGNNCQEVEIWGRPGWIKRYRKARCDFVVMRSAL